MLVLAALGAVVVAGRASAVVWVRRAVAALVAVAARVAPGSMRAASATARLVVMPALVALVERAALLAQWAPTPRRCLAVPAGPAVTLARLVRARWVLAALMEHRPRGAAALVALVEPVARAARAAMLVLAALGAVVLLGRAATVVWAWRASAALVAVAARVALGSMRAASQTVRRVVMPALAALVERAALLARLAPTLQRCSAVLAVSAVTLGSLVVARRAPVV
jgi:hypothetical protein